MSIDSINTSLRSETLDMYRRIIYSNVSQIVLGQTTALKEFDFDDASRENIFPALTKQHHRGNYKIYVIVNRLCELTVINIARWKLITFQN